MASTKSSKEEMCWAASALRVAMMALAMNMRLRRTLRLRRESRWERRTTASGEWGRSVRKAQWENIPKKKSAAEGSSFLMCSRMTLLRL